MVPYNYLVPALFWNATVKQVISLGNESTGPSLIWGAVTEATLRSEPGFEPSFTATFTHGEDYPSNDPNSADGISRPDLTGVVEPDDGDTPFLMHAYGIQYASAELDAIVATNVTTGLAVPYGAVYSVWVPSFRGGSAKYAVLQNSIFVASETVSDSPNPGEITPGHED